jgi:hypothetical protein
MLRLFVLAPWDVRWGLMRQRGRELYLAWRLLFPAPPATCPPATYSPATSPAASPAATGPP